MGSLFKKPEMPKSAILTPPASTIPEVEDIEDIEKFQRKRRGRQRTVMAGELEPLDIGKRTLLG
jgi:hypothetical protein